MTYRHGRRFRAVNDFGRLRRRRPIAGRRWRLDDSLAREQLTVESPTSGRSSEAVGNTFND